MKDIGVLIDLSCVRGNKMTKLDHKAIETLLVTKYRKKLWAPFVKGVEEFEMIKSGDHIAVAISGGKDSLLLAKLIQQLRRQRKENFEVSFILMDPGYKSEYRTAVESNLSLLGLNVHIFETPIFEASLKMSKKTPCFMCAKMRRGALYEKAKSLGCNKLALGHHYDDVIETILMNVLCGGEFKTMLPKVEAQNFSNMQLIRPMYYLREVDIQRYTKFIGIEALACGCSVTESKSDSRRKEVKELIACLSGKFENVEHAIFSASKNVRLDHILGYTYKSGEEETEIRRSVYDRTD